MNKEKQIIEEMASDIYSLLRSDTMSRAMASLLHGKCYRKITRCKDCMYSYFNPSSERYHCHRQYPYYSVEENDFCNYGKEEKEKENE